MEIRVATLEDVEAIARLKTILVQSWFDDPAPVELDADYPARLRGRIRELLDNPWYRYLVAQEDGEVVACMSASVVKHLPGPGWHGIHGHLADLVVASEYRGRGIARALMDHAMAWLVEQGVDEVDMHATRAAIPMYEAMGWRPLEPEPADGPFRTLTMRLEED